MHPCDKDDKAGCEQVCNKKGDEALCGCEEGYKVSEDDANKCEKIHPCDKEGKAGCQQKCKKIGDTAMCECNDNFKINEDGKTCKKGM